MKFSLFDDLKDIISVSKDLLGRLEATAEDWPTQTRIGKIFLDLVRLYDIFIFSIVWEDIIIITIIILLRLLFSHFNVSFDLPFDGVLLLLLLLLLLLFTNII